MYSLCINVWLLKRRRASTLPTLQQLHIIIDRVLTDIDQFWNAGGNGLSSIVLNGGSIESLYAIRTSIPIVVCPNGGSIRTGPGVGSAAVPPQVVLTGELRRTGLLSFSANGSYYPWYLYLNQRAPNTNFSGGIYVTAGYVQVTNTSSVGSCPVILDNDSVMYLTDSSNTSPINDFYLIQSTGTTAPILGLRPSSSATFDIGLLNGNGSIILGPTSGSGITTTLRVNVPSDKEAIYYGQIADQGTGRVGTLVKDGDGILCLGGKNTYSGPTIVSNGTLLVNGSIYTNSVTVCNGAKLGGSGTARGTVTVETGGVLIPGDGVGTLTTGGLVLQNNAEIWYEFSGETNSDLIVTTDLTIGTSTNVILRLKDGGVTKKPRGEYVVIQYSGTDPDLGKWVVNSEVEGISGSVYLDTSNKRVMVRLMESGTIFVIY